MRGFILGVFFTLVVIVGGVYLALRSGKVSLATSAEPLPLERDVAQLTLDANVRNAKNQANPLPHNDENTLAGAKLFKEHCVFCHGAPGQLRPPLATMLMPRPPQLFQKDDSVTDDPEGEIYWIISNGIRLSGMAGFGDHLSDNERWQLTMLLKDADKLPTAAQAELQRKEAGEIMPAGHVHEHGEMEEHDHEHEHMPEQNPAHDHQHEHLH